MSIGFDEYQTETAKTAHVSPDATGLVARRGQVIPPGIYELLGLNGEAGEVTDKIKKYWRDGGDYHETRDGVKKELGDVLWYLSRIAAQWDLKLSEVAEGNLEKLASRRARGTLHGSGDNR